jgi:hypothetical protein
MKQHYFDVPFAFAGDVTAIPDPLQVGGTVSMTEGWNYNYQRNLSTDPSALPIDRSTTNWLLLQISTALQALQQVGAPEFILAAQNGGAAYSYGQGAVVLWSASGNAPFVKYVSLTAGNVNTPSASDPLGTTTGWQVVCDPIATSTQAGAGTNNASIMTPLLVAQQTALRALLAGSSSQVFNVGPAVSATQAPQLQQMTGRLLNIQVFNASGTYTPTAGTTSIVVWSQAPGGGSGGCQGPSGGTQTSLSQAGGAGSFAMARYTSGFSGAAVVIGTAGAAGSSGGGNGGNGTSNTFGGTLLVCPGGVGGTGATALTTPPSGGGGGNLSGAPSGTGIITSRAGNAAGYWSSFNASSGLAAQGGNSFLGYGGQTSFGSAGNVGYLGGGGSGVGNPAAATSGLVGGAGGAGQMLIYEYA